MRKVRIEIQVDDATKTAWERAAKESGLTLSAWMRLRCNGIELTAAPPSITRKAA